MKKVTIDGDTFIVPQQEPENWISQVCPACEKRNFIKDESSSDNDMIFFTCAFCAETVSLFVDVSEYIEDCQYSGIIPEQGLIFFDLEGNEI